MTYYAKRQNAPDVKAAGINLATAAGVAAILDRKHRPAHLAFLASGMLLYFTGKHLGGEL